MKQVIPVFCWVNTNRQLIAALKFLEKKTGIRALTTESYVSAEEYAKVYPVYTNKTLVGIHSNGGRLCLATWEMINSVPSGSEDLTPPIDETKFNPRFGSLDSMKKNYSKTVKTCSFPVMVPLNIQYTAEIRNGIVTVGCQKFSFAVIENLYNEIQKVKAAKK